MDITAYEPLYRAGQKLAEEEFRPLTVTDNSETWREFKILTDFYRRGDHRGNGFSGILSPKFRLKTGIPGRDFMQFVSDNRGVDVCIVNPYPGAKYLSYNVWMHGEAFHPGITARAQTLLDCSGIGWDLSSAPRNNEQTLCYSNFWVAKREFWDAYLGGVLEPIARFLEGNPENRAARDVIEPTEHYANAPFLPFIIERLISTFLALNPQFSVAHHSKPYAQIAEFCDTEFEREIVRGMTPIVDDCDAACSFPDGVIRMQRLHTSLFKKYVVEHYARHPHPHTGETMPSVRDQFTKEVAPDF